MHEFGNRRCRSGCSATDSLAPPWIHTSPRYFTLLLSNDEEAHHHTTAVYHCDAGAAKNAAATTGAIRATAILLPGSTRRHRFAR
ncbi:hypothetical protein BDA96_02G226700 [Sorghum bicolor]|jgi:hypothetical protein|uniref:Uncharacterized protein n=2 Tax=Sorghum bicolor TaxID=4558 RepID=A0A921RQI4_SORBI|nr:hypothetical protein BDA96_02G226700 [Sorghum bicolor]KXG35715.1 hypothetical protein SORBI_3002G216300 [Sorghum bicolor]